MEERVLTILEVSQKQAYIFSSNKLQDNVTNSAIINWVMDEDFFAETAGELFDANKNFVYSGGGHSILEFPDAEQAKEFAKKVTARVYQEYPGLELFVTTMEYDTEKSPSENIKKLTEQLEGKKAERRASFHQGSFGVEKVDSARKMPIQIDVSSKNGQMPKKEIQTDKALTPIGYQTAWEFGKLGGKKGISNFIAVVHIDGNAMGERLRQFNDKFQKADWETYKKNIREFSTEIDRQFKESYQEMTKVVSCNLEKGNLNKLSLQDKVFPVRRIITAGDDICFVAEGRIGVECAVAFIRALNRKKNKFDEEGETYAACAGVAIVHQKYPFYRAYELAELLCSNAKKFGAKLNPEGRVSAIDWHIEYGEQKDDIEDIRKDYKTEDGKQLEMRPYIISAPQEVLEKEKVRQYIHFKRLVTGLVANLQNKKFEYARSKVKELRRFLKQGEEASKYFIRFNQIEGITLESYLDIFEKADLTKVGTGAEQEKRIFLRTSDGVMRSILFDAIELADTFIGLDEGGAE